MHCPGWRGESLRLQIAEVGLQFALHTSSNQQRLPHPLRSGRLAYRGRGRAALCLRKLRCTKRQVTEAEAYRSLSLALTRLWASIARDAGRGLFHTRLMPKTPTSTTLRAQQSDQTAFDSNADSNLGG